MGQLLRTLRFVQSKEGSWGGSVKVPNKEPFAWVSVPVPYLDRKKRKSEMYWLIWISLL